MLKSTRRRLFYALVALFLVIGSGVVLYAEGLRWDFGTWRPEKVGEIYIRSYPENVSISLNNKPITNQSGFLSRGTLIPDLLPRTYDLTLTYQGYQPWHEKAAISPSLVTEFSYAVLVPKNVATISTSSIDAFVLTTAGLILQTARNIVASGNIALGAGTIVNANPRTAPIIIQRPSGAYVLRDLVASTTLNLSALFSANGIVLNAATIPSVSPYDTTLATAGNQSHVWLMNLTTQGLIYAGKAPNGYLFGQPTAFSLGAAWAVFQPSRDVSRIQWYDESSGRAMQSSSTVSGQTVKLGYLSGSTFIALQNDGELYRYDAATDSFAKIADDVTDFSASTDGTMLAAVEHAGMEVFSFATTDYWRFNLQDAHDIKDVMWYRDNQHLFVAYTDHVAFLDLEDVALINLTTVAQGTSPAYDPVANSLYLINPQKKLVRFDFPR